jgi:preprotein translocase subunit Sec63
LTIFRIPVELKGEEVIKVVTNQLVHSSYGIHLPIYQTEVIPPTLSSAPDYYNVLGLSRDATEQEVIKAWRKAVLLHHPDKQLSNQTSNAPSSSSNVDIRLINEAKWILSDEKRRREWEEVYLTSGMSTSHVEIGI